MADEELRLEVSAQVDKFTADLDKATEAIQRMYHEGESLDKIMQELDKRNTRISGSMKDYSSNVSATGTATKTAATGAAELAANSKKVGDNVSDANSKIISQRYALYDVATTYGAISAALLGMSTLAVKTGADFESAYTNVERTFETSTAPSAVAAIREELVNLSTEIPRTFEEISKVAQLGNQLGIAAEDLTGFTETVIMASTAFGVSIEETALAFGRIGDLLDVAPEQYNALGSSIAAVGVSSQATEAQILSLAKELSAVSAGAGFSAEAVVGLSGALASLGVAPERARGSLSTYFGTLNRAVANGGDELHNFATIVGVTTTELERMVRAGEGEEVLAGFLTNMNALENVDVTRAMDALNLSQLRISDTFSRLSQNLSTYNKSQAIAAQGWAEQSELARQFSFIVDDLASEFTMLVNAMSALIAAASGGSLEGLGDLVGFLTDMTNAAREFVESDFGGAVAKVVFIMGTAVGLMALYRSATALATASTYALVTAQASLGASGARAGIFGLLQMILGIDKASRAAAGGMSLLGAATRLVGRLLLIGIIIELFTNFRGAIEFVGDALIWLGGIGDTLNAAISDWAQGVVNWANTFAEGIGPIAAFGKLLQEIFGGLAGWAKMDSTMGSWGKQLKNFAKTLPNVNQDFEDLANAAKTGAYEFDQSAFSLDGLADSASGAGDAAKSAAQEIYTLVDYASDLGSVMSRAFDIRFGSQAAMDAVTQRWIDLNNEMEDYREQVRKLQADRAVTAYFLSVAEAYGDTVRAGVLRAELAEIDRDLEDATAAVSGELEGNSAAAIKNRGTVRDLVGMYQQHIEKLAAAGADQSELNDAVNASEQEFLDQARALGFADDKLQPYLQSFRDMKVIIDRIPRNVTTTIDARNDPAMAAIDEFEARMRNLNNQTFGGGTIAAPTYQQPPPMTWAQWSQQNMRGISTSASQAQWDAYIAQGRYWYDRYLRGFREGGYTGNAGQSAPAGVVHGQEFVFTAQATKNAGVGNLYSMMRAFEQGRGYRQGGFVSPTPVAMPTSTGPNVVILDQAQFHALVNSGQVNVQIGSEQIAGAVNRQNTQYANLGRG